jgi:hypothetical protein
MNARYCGLLVFCLVVLVASPTTGEGGKEMSVQVKQGHVRATPFFLGTIVATLSYGDRVKVLESKESWIRIVPPAKGSSGWMHLSALSEKKIVLEAGEKDAEVTASGGELALAGKGFSADVEAEFKANNKDFDFSWIDRMQAVKFPPEEIVAFLQEGGLYPSQGGGQ